MVEACLVSSNTGWNYLACLYACHPASAYLFSHTGLRFWYCHSFSPCPKLRSNNYCSTHNVFLLINDFREFLGHPMSLSDWLDLALWPSSSNEGEDLFSSSLMNAVEPCIYKPQFFVGKLHLLCDKHVQLKCFLLKCNQACLYISF